MTLASSIQCGENDFDQINVQGVALNAFLRLPPQASSKIESNVVMGPGRPGQGQDKGAGRSGEQQTAALGHVDRLRSQIEALAGRGQGQGRQPGQPVTDFTEMIAMRRVVAEQPAWPVERPRPERLAAKA